MAPLPPDPCSRMKTWMATAEHAVEHDLTAVGNDQAGLDRLRSQRDPDPVKVASAEAGLAADRRQLSYDEKRLSDLQHKFDQECGPSVP
ncbi:hypothetical protein ACFWP2_01140 [Kitasatospora sp. NPDC058444]|uniref:hypothetical protein n=1 Tax=Kitasatospora sp. NPDC058444 TaxID=3346504 RepID=UPI00365B5DD3